MPSTIQDLLLKINSAILNPLILLLLAAALLIFVWGIVQFLGSEEGGEARNQGKKNLLWGLVGLLIMVSVYGLIQFILGTFGIPSDNLIFSL